MSEDEEEPRPPNDATNSQESSHVVTSYSKYFRALSDENGSGRGELVSSCFYQQAPADALHQAHIF